MFIAPFNGPAKSFPLLQDAVVLYNTMNGLLPLLNGPPLIIDPDDIQVDLPQVLGSLGVSLPSFWMVYGGSQMQVAASNMSLWSISDNYIYVSQIGAGRIADLEPGSYGIPFSGPGRGLYGPVNGSSQYNAATSSAPISLANQQPLTMQWTLSEPISGVICGPTLLDQYSNGFQFIASATGATLYYQAAGVVQYQMGSASTTNALAATGRHSLAMRVQYKGLGDAARSFRLHVDGLIDGNTIPVVSADVPYAFMNPFAVYPGFNFNYGSTIPAYVSKWNWYYLYGNHPIAWQFTPVPLGGAPPTLLPGQLPIFMVSTGSSYALSVINMTEQLNLFTQLQYVQDTLNSIKATYL